jgi:hypothetical protein
MDQRFGVNDRTESGLGSTKKSRRDLVSDLLPNTRANSGPLDFLAGPNPTLGGQVKTGHLSTLQNRPFPVSGIEAN